MDKEQNLANFSAAPQVKPSLRRFFILLLLTILSITKSIQWTYFASVTDLLSRYYGVSNLAINCNPILLMLTYLALALPVNLIVERIGLRNSMIIGSLGTTIGTLTKCFSCDQDGYWINMTGHLLIGLTEPFFFSAYSRIASVWFPENQVSSATSVALAGDQLGIALGFLLPSLMLGTDPEDSESIKYGLINLFGSLSLVLVVNTLTIIYFFEEQPKYPPSLARLRQIETEKKFMSDGSGSLLLSEQLQQLRSFMRERNFLILLFGFGVNEAVNYTIHTLLNQMVIQMPINENGEVAGMAGFVLIISGVFGGVFCGFLLDRFHKYKSTTLVIYSIIVVTMIIFIRCLYLTRVIALYFVMVPLGFFNMGFTSIGFDYAVEITYPRSEQMSATLINLVIQFFGIPISFVGSMVVDEYGNLAVGVMFTTILLIGLAVTCFEHGELRRQQASHS